MMIPCKAIRNFLLFILRIVAVSMFTLSQWNDDDGDGIKKNLCSHK